MYEYRCIGHTFLAQHAMGQAPAIAQCPDHLHDAQRVFCDQRFNTNDQFRSYHLSGRRDRAESHQGRSVAGPRDNAEARDIGDATGRIYIGDDSDKLSAAGQQAVSRTDLPHQRRDYTGEG
jgi:hypothetical protein